MFYVIDVIAIILIFLIVAFVIKNYNKDYVKNLSLKQRGGIGVFICAILFVFLSTMSSSSANAEIKEEIQPVNVMNKQIEKLSLNKIIVIGDSRMSLIESSDDLNIPKNMSFIAKSGATFDWTRKEAKERLENVLEDNSTYHVVLNMGVNDINYSENIRLIAKNYYNLYQTLFNKYSHVNFYLLSVNPIDEEVTNSRSGNRTNAKIEAFNSYLIAYMKKDKAENVKYCDSYNRLDFTLPDGLHYDNKTDQKIIDYITNDCIDYK